MKLYDFAMAPNPRRVRVFAAEKGIDLEKEQVDLGSRGQLDDAYKGKKPVGRSPSAGAR